MRLHASSLFLHIANCERNCQRLSKCRQRRGQGAGNGGPDLPFGYVEIRHYILLMSQSEQIAAPVNPYLCTNACKQIGRIGEPGDMAGTVLYLCSRAGSFVTGAVLPVGGGVEL